MGMSHATCTHPRTPAGRAACRARGGPASGDSFAPAPTRQMISSLDSESGRLSEVRALAIRLMGEFGLVGWRFAWDAGRRRYGRCSYHIRTISISSALAAANDVATTEKIIRHEIAHAMVGPGYGHGPVWQAMAVRCGADPRRYYDSSKVIPPAGSYTGTCPNGHTSTRYRMISAMQTGRLACSTCCRTYNGGRFSPDYLLVWTRN